MSTLTQDARLTHGWLHSLLELDGNAEILDIGCGAGYDLIQLGRRVGDHSRLVGLDQSMEAIQAAQDATFGDVRFQFEQYAVDEQLPWATNSFDVVMANNFLECVEDKQQVISEIHRVLRPGGQVICAHFDWDTQVFNGSNKQLIRKILQAYSDWQQPWMPNCDGWVGRRLWGEFAGCGLFDGGIETYVMTNISYDESNFGYQRVRDFQELIKSGAITMFSIMWFCFMLHHHMMTTLYWFARRWTIGWWWNTKCIFRNFFHIQILKNELKKKH